MCIFKFCLLSHTTHLLADLFNRPWSPFLLHERCMVDSLKAKRHRWPHWVLENPQRLGFDERCYFRSAVAALLDSAKHVAATVLVTAIVIAVGNDDDGAEGIIYDVLSI